MSKTPKCICGHIRAHHFDNGRGPKVSDSGATSLWCLGDPDHWRGGCGCEGWMLPAKPGTRLQFGRDRLPMRVAERAPAWSRPGDDE